MNTYRERDKDDRPDWDAILSYHGNPFTCGVAKANVRLARQLGLPVWLIGEGLRHAEMLRPLLSIKPSEIDPIDLIAWPTLVADLTQGQRVFDVWLHGAETLDSLPLLRAARHLFRAADTGCPALVEGSPPRSGPHLLMFGMAGKWHEPPIRHLHHIFASMDYTVSVSVAIHDGHAPDLAWSITESLRMICGAHLRVLGSLADDGLVWAMAEVDGIVTSFDPAARANNTTLWAALASGRPVYTTLDRHSPAGLVHGQTCFDIAQLAAYPDVWTRQQVGEAGRALADTQTWAALIDNFVSIETMTSSPR
jgi:hypothetical protein